VDPWALRHCLAAVLPFREEVPAEKTLNIITKYVPPARFFNLILFQMVTESIHLFL
jgi:hypothetical protein